MSEQTGFENNRSIDAANARVSEALFESTQPEPAKDAVRNALQALAPDKPLYMAESFATMPASEQAAVSACMASYLAICAKACEPLRNAYNAAMREGATPDVMAKLEKFAASVQKVHSENRAEIAAECPARIAFPVFVTGHAASGKMEARIGHAFFPPLRADVCENSIVLPVHFADARAEKRARQNVSYETSVSSWEIGFQAKRLGIVQRRERQAEMSV